MPKKNKKVTCALMLGRKGSKGFPGKNIYPLLGRPMMLYPLEAAKASSFIQNVYVSTDSLKIKNYAKKSGAFIINRPNALASPQALGDDAFVHGYETIKKILRKQKQELELLVLLFCNGVTISTELINTGIKILRKKPRVDSAVSVSKYNMWSPLRARKIGKDGLLHPFVPFETFGDPSTLNCDRDSQGDVWFADMGVSIVRPRCLDHLDKGLLPQRWMGRNIYPLKQWGGLDVDYEWQVPQVEFWLKSHGRVNKKTSIYRK